MTLGEKIKKYRELRELTQRELGQKVGFSAGTEDSRIRKYEKNMMAPKTDIRRKIAEALDIDMSALNDIDIQTEKDAIRVLFYLEEKYGLAFTLLADPERKVIEVYDVWKEKKNYGKVSMGVVRTTYLIDEQGIIIKANDKVKAADDPENMLKELN